MTDLQQALERPTWEELQLVEKRTANFMLSVAHYSILHGLCHNVIRFLYVVFYCLVDLLSFDMR